MNQFPTPLASRHATPRARLSTRLLAILMFGIAIVSAATICLLVVTAGTAVAAAVSPISLELRVLKEERKAAADGTTEVKLTDASRIVPGDRLVYILTYTNTGTRPISDVVLNYPLPEGVAYRAAAEGSQAPLVSTDGQNFGTGDLAASDASKAITALRWQVPGEVAPGAKGEVAFKATLN